MCDNYIIFRIIYMPFGLTIAECIRMASAIETAKVLNIFYLYRTDINIRRFHYENESLHPGSGHTCSISLRQHCIAVLRTKIQ